jgi:hypothetical protein
MNEDDPLQQWMEAERAAGVPEGFEDRVMDAVRASAGPRDWWQRPGLRAAAWTAASLVVAARVAATLLLFVGG